MSKEAWVLTYYLEMKEAPKESLASPHYPFHIDHLHTPDIPTYRSLYNEIGARYNWVDRKMMSDEKLLSIIQDAKVAIYIAYLEEQPVGFAELDFREEGTCELAYFGLMNQAQGKGLGKYFLLRVIQKAWEKPIQRLHVHTCEWDHPAALTVYQKAGFEIFEEKRILQLLPE